MSYHKKKEKEEFKTNPKEDESNVQAIHANKDIYYYYFRSQ